MVIVRPAPILFGAPLASARGPEGGRAAVRQYEIVIILDAALEEEAVGSMIDRATEAIRAKGGVPGQVEKWGKRRFAYELHHRWVGYYVLLPVGAEPGALNDVDRMLFL